MVNFKTAWDVLTQKEILPQKKALQYFLDVLKTEDLRPILPKIEAPALIISGIRILFAEGEKQKNCRKICSTPV
jgi:hypothetical protein